MNFRARLVLFDLDGTLIDSIAASWEAHLSFLRKFNITADRADFEEINGPSLIQIASLLKAKYKFRQSEEEIMGLYEKTLDQVYKNVRLFPDALPALKYFSTRKKKIGLVSSAPRRLGIQIVQGLGIYSFFDGFFFGDDVVRSKPDPAVYLAALEYFSEKAEAAAAVEDSQAGVQSAVLAGIQVFRISRGSDYKEPGDQDTIRVVRSLQEFCSLVSD